jgi:hypothetical protein
MKKKFLLLIFFQLLVIKTLNPDRYQQTFNESGSETLLKNVDLTVLFSKSGDGNDRIKLGPRNSDSESGFFGFGYRLSILRVKTAHKKIYKMSLIKVPQNGILQTSNKMYNTIW